MNDNSFPLNVFPNPSRDYISINYFLINKESISFELYDSYGQLVKTIKDKILPPEIYSQNLDLKELQNGIYSLQLKTGKNISIKKFIKAE